LSINNCSLWTDVSKGLPRGTRIRSFAISGTNIFVGTWDGVYLSTDNGSNWSSVNDGLKYTGIYCILVVDNTIFAGTYGGGLWKCKISEMVKK